MQYIGYEIRNEHHSLNTLIPYFTAYLINTLFSYLEKIHMNAKKQIVDLESASKNTFIKNK